MIEMLKPEDEIEFRTLTPTEIASVEHVFREQGASLPDPSISTFVGAVRDGRVLGFLVVQLKLHAEPMWISEGNSGIFPRLARAAEQVILERAGPQWVYLFAPAGRIAQLAQTLGMQLEPWVVLSKLIQPELPSKAVVSLEPLTAERLPEQLPEPLEASVETIQ